MANYETSAKAKMYGHTMVAMLPRDWHDFEVVDIGDHYYVTGNTKRMVYSKERTIGSKRYTMRYRWGSRIAKYPLLTLSKDYYPQMGIEDDTPLHISVDGSGTITVRRAD